MSPKTNIFNLVRAMDVVFHEPPVCTQKKGEYCKRFRQFGPPGYEWSKMTQLKCDGKHEDCRGYERPSVDIHDSPRM